MPKQLKKILIVDDEPDIVEILSYNLAKNEDFEIFKAYDGSQAFDSAVSILPDVIIMDIWMPGISGLEACRMIRRNAALKSTPVLILTSDTDEYKGLEAAAAGCNEFVTKSVKPAFIVAMVKDLIAARNH